MRQFTEERVEVDDDPVVTNRVGPAAWNPAPIIGAVVIGLLVLFLIIFAMGHRTSRGTTRNAPGVTITTPSNNTNNGSTKTTTSSPSTGSGSTSGSVKTSTP